jgi:putative Ca2+/H+ antiporter (TMEM165/GDT1 family)
VPGNWVEVRNFLITSIKDLLDDYNAKYKDSKTFEEEKEVILQYFVFFEKYTWP